MYVNTWKDQEKEGLGKLRMYRKEGLDSKIGKRILRGTIQMYGKHGN